MAKAEYFEMTNETSSVHYVYKKAYQHSCTGLAATHCLL